MWPHPLLGWIIALSVLSATSGFRQPPDINRVGGTLLVYRLATVGDGQPVPLSAGQREKLIQTLLRRLDATGRRGIGVRFRDDDRVEIAVPGADPQLLQRVKRLATAGGKFELLIVANSRDHARLIELARRSPAPTVQDGARVIGRWVRVRPPQAADAGGAGPGMAVSLRALVLRNAESKQRIEEAADDVGRPGSGPDAEWTRLAERGIKSVEALVVVDPDPARNFDARHLADATVGFDDFKRPLLAFRTSPDGAPVLYHVTKTNLPDAETAFYRMLGILIDDELVSAPRIMSTIVDRGQITGNFTVAEVESLVAVLKAGSLPVALSREPVEERRVEPESADESDP